MSGRSHRLWRPRWSQKRHFDADYATNRELRKLTDQEHEHAKHRASLVTLPGFRSKLTGFARVPSEPEHGHDNPTRKVRAERKARITLAPSPWR